MKRFQHLWTCAWLCLTCRQDNNTGWHCDGCSAPQSDSQ